MEYSFEIWAKLIFWSVPIRIPKYVAHQTDSIHGPSEGMGVAISFSTHFGRRRVLSLPHPHGALAKNYPDPAMGGMSELRKLGEKGLRPHICDSAALS
jgi:hypothetical protein